MKVKMPLTITNSEYDTLLEKIGSLDAKLQRIKLDKRDFGEDARLRAQELTLNAAVKNELEVIVDSGLNRVARGLTDSDKKLARSTATDVKKLVKRLGKDDGKTVELLEDIQAKLLGISKQMRVTENKDIKRWDALMSHLNRARWWQVWKWSIWNFRISFTRRED